MPKAFFGVELSPENFNKLTQGWWELYAELFSVRFNFFLKPEVTDRGKARLQRWKLRPRKVPGTCLLGQL